MKTNMSLRISMYDGTYKHVEATKFSDRFAIQKDIVTDWYMLTDIETGLGVIKAKTVKDIKFLGEILLKSFEETPFKPFDSQILYSKIQSIYRNGGNPQDCFPKDVVLFGVNFKKNLVDCPVNFILAC